MQMRATKAKVGKKTIRLIRIGKILLMVACIGVGTGSIFLIRAEGEKVQKSRLYLEYLKEGEQLFQDGSYVNAEKSYPRTIREIPVSAAGNMPIPSIWGSPAASTGNSPGPLFLR